jgi:hypothetical protein
MSFETNSQPILPAFMHQYTLQRTSEHPASSVGVVQSTANSFPTHQPFYTSYPMYNLPQPYVQFQQYPLNNAQQIMPQSPTAFQNMYANYVPANNYSQNTMAPNQSRPEVVFNQSSLTKPRSPLAIVRNESVINSVDTDNSPLNSRQKYELTERPWNLLWEIWKTYSLDQPVPHNLKNDLMKPPYKQMFPVLDAWKRAHPDADIWALNERLPVVRTGRRPTPSEAFAWAESDLIDADLYSVGSNNNRTKVNRIRNDQIHHHHQSSQSKLSSSLSDESIDSKAEERLTQNVLKKILAQQQALVIHNAKNNKRIYNQIIQRRELQKPSISLSVFNASVPPKPGSIPKRFIKRKATNVDTDNDTKRQCTSAALNEGIASYDIDTYKIPSLPQRAKRIPRSQPHHSVADRDAMVVDLSSPSPSSTATEQGSGSSVRSSASIDTVDDDPVNVEHESDDDDEYHKRRRKAVHESPVEQKYNDEEAEDLSSNSLFKDIDIDYSNSTEQQLLHEVGRNKSLITLNETYMSTCQLIKTKRELYLYLDSCKVRYSKTRTMSMLKQQLLTHYKARVNIFKHRLTIIQTQLDLLRADADSDDDSDTVDLTKTGRTRKQ